MLDERTGWSIAHTPVSQNSPNVALILSSLSRLVDPKSI